MLLNNMLLYNNIRLPVNMLYEKISKYPNEMLSPNIFCDTFMLFFLFKPLEIIYLLPRFETCLESLFWAPIQSFEIQPINQVKIHKRALNIDSVQKKKYAEMKISSNINVHHLSDFNYTYLWRYDEYDNITQRLLRTNLSF
jgi:hypothetical protein